MNPPRSITHARIAAKTHEAEIDQPRGRHPPSGTGPPPTVTATPTRCVGPGPPPAWDPSPTGLWSSDSLGFAAPPCGSRADCPFCCPFRTGHKGQGKGNSTTVGFGCSQKSLRCNNYLEPPRGLEPRAYALRARSDEFRAWVNRCVPTVSGSPWSVVIPLEPTCFGSIPGYDSTLAEFQGSAATRLGDLPISHLGLRTRQWVGGLSLRNVSIRPTGRRPGLRCLVSSRANAAGRGNRGPWACQPCFHFGNIVGVTDSTDFARRLETLLEERDMTQLELAARVGVTRAAMSRYVSGDREPRFVTLVRIAEELDVRVEDLLPTSGDPVQTALRIVARTPLTEEQKAQFRRVLDEGDLE